MSNNVGGANVEITADDSQARSTFDRFGRYLEKLGKTGQSFANTGVSLFQRIERQMQATQSTLESIDRTLANINKHIRGSVSALDEFSQSSKNTQDQYSRSQRELERSLRQSGMGFREAREQALAMRAASLGTEQVLKNMNQRLSESTTYFKRFSEASNNIQAQRAFSQIESAIRRTRTELSMLGFGKTKTEIQALEGQLYNFANVRMDNLRDQIKLTERALAQMKNSADASKYAEQIKAAEAALAAYKAQVQDLNAVQKMAEVNGYNVIKAFGKDVFVKPLEGFQRFKAQVTGFFNTDLAYLANKTYKTIDGAAKAIVGSADTIAEQKRKIQQLTTTYQTLGTTINTRVTPFVLALGAAFAYVGAKAEQAYYKFEAQTLTPRVNMTEYKDAMADVYAETGQARDEISKVFAYLKNKYDATAEAAKSLATKGADFADVWGSGDAQTSIKSIETMRKTMRLLKVDEEQAANALALALKRTNGDWEEATKSLTQYGDVYKKLVTGKKITEADARAAAERNVAKAIREQSQEYIRLQREKKRLEKQRDATKDKQQKAIIDQTLATVESDMKRIQENMGKGREEMLQREIKLMMQLQELDPLNAYENMGNAEGAVEAVAKAWRNLVNVIEELFDALAPTIEMIGNKLTDMAAAAVTFLRNNPGFATFVAHMVAAGAAITVLIGVLAPVAFGLLFLKDAFLAVSLSMGALSKGAIAVLPPRVVQMTKSFDMFRNAIIGLPRILAGLGPALATMFRTAPMALAKFVADFVKMNPMLTAFSLLGIVIAKNWDKVGPILSKIWQDVLLAFQPVVQAFSQANSTIWPTLMNLLNQIAQVAGVVLVDALKVIEPIIRAIALAINGDFKGALGAFDELADQAVTIGGVLGALVIAWAGYKTAVTVATLVTEAYTAAQGAMVTASTLAVTGVGRITGALAALRLAVMSNPIGLIITGLTLAGGAALAFSSDTEQAKEASLEHYDALVKQKKSLQDTVTEYEGLRSSIKLSQPELLRYMDLQKQIARETNPDRLKVLRMEQEELAKKSGVTAEQLQRFFQANDKIIQQAPATEQAISAEGAALAKSADAAKQLVSELAKKSKLELETQKANADAQMEQNLQKYAQTVQRINNLQTERIALDERIKARIIEVQQAETNLQKAKQDGSYFDIRAAETKLENLKGTLALERNELVLKSQQQLEASKELSALNQSFEKTKQIYQAMIQRHAQQAGINAEVGKEVQVIDTAIKKHEQARNQLLEKQRAGAKLTAEQEKQLAKTDEEIQKLNEAKGAIQGLQKEQADVNKKIDDGKKKSDELTKSLSEKTEKPVDTKQIDAGNKKTDELNSKIQKPTTKPVNVQVNDSPLQKLIEWLKTPFTKTINIISNLGKVGKDTVDGFIGGMDSRKGEVSNKASEIGSIVPRVVRKVLDTHSPSKVMQSVGHDTADGLTKGLEEKKDKVKKSSKTLGEKVLEGMKEATDKLETQLSVLKAKFELGEIINAKNPKALLDFELKNLNEQFKIQQDVVNRTKAAYDKLSGSKNVLAKDMAEAAQKYATEAKSLSELADKISDVRLAIASNSDATARARERIEELNAEHEREMANLDENAGKMAELELHRKQTIEDIAAQKDLVAQLNQKYLASIELKGEDSKATREAYMEYSKARTEQAKLEKELRSTNKAIVDQKKEIEDAAEKASQKMREQQQEIQDTINKVGELASKYRNDLTKAQEEYQQKVADTNRKLLEDEQNVTKQYENELQNRAKSLRDFVGLFDAVQTKEVTGTQLLDNLKGQVDAFESWQKNMTSLSGRGIDTDLLKELRDMGPKAASEIAALNTLSDTELNQYVALWREKNQLAKNEATTQLEETKQEMYSKLAELRVQASQQLQQYADEWQKKNEEITKNTTEELKKMVDEAGKKGEEMIASLALAITKSLPQLASAFRGIPIFDALLGDGNPGGAAVDGAKQQADGVIGETVRQKTGVIDNTNQMMQAVNQVWAQASQQMAQQQEQIRTQMLTTWQTIQQQLTTLWNKMLSDMKKIWTEKQKFLFEVLKQVETRFNGLVAAASNWGINLMDNFISAVQSQFGRLHEVMFNMTQIVDSYMPHSPAKVGPLSTLDEWGPGMIGAFVEGIQASIPSLKKAINQVTSISNVMPSSSIHFPSAITSDLLSKISVQPSQNTFEIYLAPGSTDDQVDELLRALYRRGVRFD